MLLPRAFARRRRVTVTAAITMAMSPTAPRIARMVKLVPDTPGMTSWGASELLAATGLKHVGALAVPR